MIFSGIMLVAVALGIQRYPVFEAAALLTFLLGMVISPIMIASNTIIHSVSENAMMGKIFSALGMVIHLGFLLFMFISSILAERFPPLIILVVVGCLLSLLGVGNLLFNRKISCSV